MSDYRDNLQCGEYIPLCVMNELERLNNKILELEDTVLKLRKEKVDRTMIVPDRIIDNDGRVSPHPKGSPE